MQYPPNPPPPQGDPPPPLPPLLPPPDPPQLETFTVPEVVDDWYRLFPPYAAVTGTEPAI